jgi:hypothetical protein
MVLQHRKAALIYPFPEVQLVGAAAQHLSLKKSD